MFKKQDGCNRSGSMAVQRSPFINKPLPPVMVLVDAKLCLIFNLRLRIFSCDELQSLDAEDEATSSASQRCREDRVISAVEEAPVRRR